MPKLIEDARHRASAPSHDGEGASPRPAEPSRARCRARAKTLLTILAALVLAPLTVVVGMGIPGNGYYLSGTLIVLYAIVPFFVSFEGRRPTAREIAVVAVLTALAVAARAAFIWVPHFKPMAAVIMIAGLAAGPQTGFLVGSVAALASNFIFGQGPWTPWQMLAFGVAGPVPMRASHAEEFINGKPVTLENIEDFGKAVLEDIHPRDSWRASKAFRSHIAVESAKRCLMESVKLAGGEL